MKNARLVIVVLSCLAISGCVAIPVPSKPMVGKKTQTLIVAGETSRDEVLALLGYPHSESDDRRANLYYKDQHVGELIFMYAGSLPIMIESLYLVRYDKKNVVQSARAANDIADFCYADGICHASKVDLSIMFVSDQRENAAKLFPETSRKCSLVILDKYRRDWNTRGYYMANALVRVDGRGIFKARPKAPVSPNPSNWSEPRDVEDFGQSEILTGFFRIDVAPGQHRISYNQPRIGTVPTKPLTLKCNAGDILFVAPRGPKPFESTLPWRSRPKPDTSPTYSFFILPPEQGDKILKKARLYQGQS
jgi:hypothetical protein